MMTIGSCPNCGTTMEPDSRFCHNCGLDATHPTPTSFPTAAPMYPQFPPWGMYPQPMYEAPIVPVGHQRALAGMSGVITFFVTALILLPGIFYLDDSWRWEEEWVEDDWVERRVVRWDMVIAGMFTMTAFGMGIVGGIACVRAKRFLLAVIASVMLFVSAMLFPAYGWSGFDFADYELELLFYPLMAAFALGLVLLARPSFTEPLRISTIWGRPHSNADEYGWNKGVGP